MRKGGLRFKVEGVVKRVKESPDIALTIGKKCDIYEDEYEFFTKALDVVTELKYLPHTFFKYVPVDDFGLEKEVRRIWKECYANVDEFAPYMDRNSIIYHTKTFDHFTHRIKVYLKQKIREAKSAYYADLIAYCYVNDWEVTSTMLCSHKIDPTGEIRKMLLETPWIKKHNEWVAKLESTNTN